MKQHIEQTLADLDSKIASLTTLRTNILEHFGSFNPIPVGHDVRSASPAPRPSPRQPSRPSRPLRDAKSPAPIRRASPGSFLPTLAALPEPITNKAIQAAAKCDSKKAGNIITRAKMQGLLVNTATMGEYRKTAKLNKLGSPVGHDVRSATPARERAPTPASDKSVPSDAPENETTTVLQDKLEKFLKLRDANRAAGRDALAQVFQNDIDKLEAELKSRS